MDLEAFRRTGDWHAASYPASITGGGGTPPATNVFPDGVTAGTPGTFTNPLSPPATLDIPDDIAALQALGALGATAAWATGEYVELEDASHAYWDGSAWAVGEAPVPPPPPGPTPDDTWLKSEIIDWLNDHGDPAQDSLTKAELLDHVTNILDTD